MKKHVIFDFDGTLLNTDEIIVESWQTVFRHYKGREGSLPVIYDTFGETVVDTMKRLFPEADQDEAIGIYRKYQREHYRGKVGLYDGMTDLVGRLRDGGFSTSIVTSRTGNTTRDYLSKFGVADLFDVIVTCEDTDAHKPDPRPLLIALDKLGADKDDAIMLGDTKYDIGCCNNAGVDSVLVRWGHTADESKFGGYRPTYRIDQPSELIGILRK